MGSFVYLCLLPELWSVKCQKWLILCTFCWIQQKISPSLGKIFKCIWKDLLGPFRKLFWSMYFSANISKTSTFKSTGFWYLFVHFFVWYQKSFWYLSTISHKQLSQRLLTIPFSAITQKDLPCILKHIAQTATNFLQLSAENTKLAILYILKAITMGVKIKARQMTTFFHLFWSSIHWFVSF